MTTWLLVLATVAACGSAALTVVLLVRALGLRPEVDVEHLGRAMRAEMDRLNQRDDDRGRALRQEIGNNLRGFQDSSLVSFRELGDGLAGGIRDFASRLDASVRTIDDRTTAFSNKLELDIARMGDEAVRGRDALRLVIENKLDDSVAQHSSAAKDLREELGSGFQRLSGSIAETLNQSSVEQRQRLDTVSAALVSFTEKHERAQENLRQAVETRLDAIRTENSSKLDEMRKTVDEKLQSTLEARLGESFNRVVEQLERVHKGIGEMQSLATGVGDLKRVLSNVRARGAFGEVQLGVLLDQFLSPEQYSKNVQVKENTQERVEFAIRLPGRDDVEVLLPVDAKFPMDDYERLLAASQAGDAEMVASASRDLESSIRSFARTISEKYISPPRTTDFAILFLPTESLYAEVLRSPGLLESLQRDFRVTLAGPTTFAALLNGLQMGFRSLAIEKRSSEVWEILGAVRSEFSKYNTVVNRLAKQLDTAAKSVDALGVRTRVIDRKLGSVERLADRPAQVLLGTDLNALPVEDEADESGQQIPVTEPSAA